MRSVGRRSERPDSRRSARSKAFRPTWSDPVRSVVTRFDVTRSVVTRDAVARSDVGRDAVARDDPANGF